MTTAIILGVALALLLIVALIREIEIRRSKTSALSALVSRLDPLCARALKKGVHGVFSILYGLNTIKNTFVLSAHRVGKHLHFHAHHTVKRTHRLIKGHRKLNRGGAVNFFFHSIGEDKKLKSHHVGK